MAIETVEDAARLPSSGLTVGQAELAFEEIASCACTLAALLQDEMCSSAPGEGEKFHAMVALAERIGSIADAASGEVVVGSVFNWTLGPRFRHLADAALEGARHGA